MRSPINFIPNSLHPHYIYLKTHCQWVFDNYALIFSINFIYIFCLCFMKYIYIYILINAREVFFSIPHFAQAVIPHRARRYRCAPAIWARNALQSAQSIIKRIDRRQKLRADQRFRLRARDRNVFRQKRLLTLGKTQKIVQVRAVFGFVWWYE